jgi:hypothetical protein
VENTIGVNNMPREEWYIHYHSNIRKEATKDAAAMRGLHEAERDISANRVISKKQLTDEFKRKVKDRTITGQLTKKVTNWSKALQKNTIIQRALAKSSHTAGINVGMLSLRISEGLIPVLLLAYSAILPVVAGLLAIASASVVAAAGVAGVLGLGVAALSTKRGAPPVWGARNVTEDKDVFAELLEPLKDALKSRELKSSIRVVTELTEDFFGDTLPKSFKAFVSALDMKAISNMFKSFQDFLPRAAKSVAELGNEIYSAIGKRSLQSIKKLFKYLANGLKSTAVWLKEGGFEDIEYFAGTIGRFIGKLMELGKSVLPILSGALDAIYPSPIEPVINLLVLFFDSIKDTKVQTAINGLVKIATALVILNGALKFAGAILGGASAIYKVFYDGKYGLVPILRSIAPKISGLLAGVEIRAAIGALAKIAGGVLTFAAIVLTAYSVLKPTLGYLSKLSDKIKAGETEAVLGRGLRETTFASGLSLQESIGSAVLGGTQPIELTIYNETNLDSDVIDTSFTRKFFEPAVPTNNSGRFSLIGGK